MAWRTPWPAPTAWLSRPIAEPTRSAPIGRQSFHTSRGDTTFQPPRTSRFQSPPAWCYGAPGVARALWLAARALGRIMRSASSRSRRWRRCISGRSKRGESTRRRFATALPACCRSPCGLRTTGSATFTNAAAALTEQLLSLHLPERTLGYCCIEPAREPGGSAGLTGWCARCGLRTARGILDRRAKLGSAVSSLLMKKPRARQSFYDPLGWVVIRAPLLPIDAYLALGNKDSAAGTGWRTEIASGLPADPLVGLRSVSAVAISRTP